MEEAIVRLNEQERRLLNALADRQAKLEDEWQMRRQTETEAQGLGKLADDLTAIHASALAAEVTPPATRQRR